LKQFNNELADLIPENIARRTYFITQDGLGLWDWTAKVYDYMEGLK
jgi:hypothetical protein